jgi:hypothetical protein
MKARPEHCSREIVVHPQAAACASGVGLLRLRHDRCAAATWAISFHPRPARACGVAPRSELATISTRRRALLVVSHRRWLFSGIASLSTRWASAAARTYRLRTHFCFGRLPERRTNRGDRRHTHHQSAWNFAQYQQREWLHGSCDLRKAGSLHRSVLNAR